VTAAPARHRATYADLSAVPAGRVAELIGGDLVTQPRPSPLHSLASLALGRELSGPMLGGPGGEDGWIFMVEPELHLGSDVVVPDLAAWRRSRLPSLPETAWLDVAPDWVCELLSSSTQTWDRGPKRRIYADAGVPHLSLVDPVGQFIEGFTLVDGHWLLLGTISGEDPVRLPPFESVSFPLATLWPLDPPQSPTPADR
jgi:Uma2 family endonuclease